VIAPEAQAEQPVPKRAKPLQPRCRLQRRPSPSVGSTVDHTADDLPPYRPERKSNKKVVIGVMAGLLGLLAVAGILAATRGSGSADAPPTTAATTSLAAATAIAAPIPPPPPPPPAVTADPTPPAANAEPTAVASAAPEAPAAPASAVAVAAAPSEPAVEPEAPTGKQEQRDQSAHGRTRSCGGARSTCSAAGTPDRQLSSRIWSQIEAAKGRESCATTPF